MTLARRQFLQSVGGGAALAAAMPSTLLHAEAAAGQPAPVVVGLDRPALHVELGGLAAFEWWKTDKRVAVHFMSGRSGSHAVPHRLVLTADMNNVHEGSIDPQTLVMLPGAASPLGAWALDGYELRVDGAPAKGALQVEAQAPEMPAPAQPDNPDSWKSIHWLSPYQEVFGTASVTTTTEGPDIAGRLQLTGGRLQCLMPADKDYRRVVFEFVDKGGKKVGKWTRAMSDRVLYEFPLVKSQATIVGTPLPGGTAKTPLKIAFKSTKAIVAIPITIMALPIRGGLSAQHFEAFGRLVRGTTSTATPQIAGECVYDSGKCVVTKPDPGKYPGDVQHCFVPLIMQD